eukprot:gene47744-58491_t
MKTEPHAAFSMPAQRKSSQFQRLLIAGNLIALALLAGGNGAMFQAVEGAEDDREQGAADLLAACCLGGQYAGMFDLACSDPAGAALLGGLRARHARANPPYGMAGAGVDAV